MKDTKRELKILHFGKKKGKKMPKEKKWQKKKKEIDDILFTDNVNEEIIIKFLKGNNFIIRGNTIGSLVAHNIFNEEIKNVLIDIAHNGNKRIYYIPPWYETDFAIVALHIFGYKEIPLTYFGKELLEKKDIIFETYLKPRSKTQIIFSDIKKFH